MLSTKAKKLKDALEKETGKMVTFRSKARYNASQARLARQRRQKAKDDAQDVEDTIYSEVHHAQ